MELFDHNHRYHSNVSWPHDLEQLPIWLPSTLIQHLAHNNPPSLEELQQITEFQQKTLQEAAENDQRIRVLRQQLKLLKSEKRTLEKSAFVCHVVRSPIRRLPLEILHLIATFDAPPSTFCFESLLSPKHHFPLLLSHVSSSWRHIIHEASPLWQKLRLPLRNRDVKDQNVMHELEYFGKLSGQLPLSLQLQNTDYYNGSEGLDDIDDPKSILPWLLLSWPDRHRLTNLSICYPPQPGILHFLKHLLCDQAGSGLGLTSLALIKDQYVGTSNRTCDSDLIMQICQTLPNLRHIWLDWGKMVIDVDDFLRRSIISETPWAKISTLHITKRFQPREWATFVRACPNLNFGEFWISGPTEPLNNPFLHLPQSPYFHRCLKELIIKFCDYSTHILVPFAGIQFPCLKTLQIGFEKCHLRTTRNPNDVDFVRPFPSLQNLEILHTSEIKNIRGLFPIFIATRSITSLSVSFSLQRILDFVGFLHPVNSGMLRLSCLKTLKLGISAFGRWGNDSDVTEEQDTQSKERERLLALSLLDMWDARCVKPTQDNSGDDRALESMSVEFHPRHRYRLEENMAVFLAWDYIQKKVAKRGSGIDVVLVNDEVHSVLGSPLEQRLKRRFEL